MKLWSLALIGALSLLGCGGDVETHGGGSCPTCSGGGITVNNANACASERRVGSLASEPGSKGGGGGGTPTTTTTTTTGTPFAAPTTNVTVNTPPSTQVSNSCGGGAVPAP